MSAELPTRVKIRVQEWVELWGTPDLTKDLSLQISTRLRTTLGRCRPQQAQIKIAAFLLSEPGPILEEVVCHELAHAAAFRLHGQGIRPHGPEWKELMRTAGYTPRPRLSAPEHALLPAAARHPRVRWEHRCQVCHAVREAGRPVPQWRCAACREAGLEGELTITRHPQKAGRA